MECIVLQCRTYNSPDRHQQSVRLLKTQEKESLEDRFHCVQLLSNLRLSGEKTPDFRGMQRIYNRKPQLTGFNRVGFRGITGDNGSESEIIGFIPA